MENSEKNDAHGATKQQFKISSLFWITFFVAAIIAYLQRTTSAGEVKNWWIFLVDGVVFGTLISLPSRRFIEGIFWGVLIAAFGFISVTSDPVANAQQAYAWTAVGAVAGAIGGTVYLTSIGKSLASAAVASAVMMYVYRVVIVRGMEANVELYFDLCAAPVIGGLVVITIRTIMWAETERPLPRYVTATWLLMVVIAGNLIARW